MSIGIEIDVQGLERFQKRMAALSRDDFTELLESIGGLLESQTRNRIQNTKQSPSGESWVEWSPAYAKTRHRGHSLLVNEGDLLDSIQYAVSGDDLEVGSNLVYAATHQFGRDKIPQREFLGLSQSDEQAVVALVEDFIDDITRGRRT